MGLAVLGVALLLGTGCGSGSKMSTPSTPVASMGVSITGTSGALTHSVPLTLNVQ
jgi:hypothetical protein